MATQNAARTDVESVERENPVAWDFREKVDGIVVDPARRRAVLTPHFGEVTVRTEIMYHQREFRADHPLWYVPEHLGTDDVVKRYLDMGELGDVDGLARWESKDGSREGYAPVSSGNFPNEAVSDRRPDGLPDVWEVEDWRTPAAHPHFPDQYVTRRPDVQAVTLHKERLPWPYDMDDESLRRLWSRRLNIPDGWEWVQMVRTDEHPLERMYRKRRRDDRMMNVIITARDSATGTGKTSLAVDVAKRWDENGWSAEKATLDPREYQRKYEEVDSGSVLILDEAEQAADNRRSMSDQNLTLTHLWATMRFKQVSSIITLPTVTMLDKRLKELADVRIHVVKRGWAKVYKVKVEDTGQHRVFEKEIAIMTWDAMDDDPDYQALSKKKAERMDGYSVGEDADEDRVNPDEIAREKRNELVRQMNEHDDLTQEEIGEIVGLSRSAVSRIANGE